MTNGNGKEVMINQVSQTNQVNQVNQVIQKLQSNNEWLLFVKALSIWLNDHIEKVSKELGKNVNTASLRYTAITKTITESINDYSGIRIEDPIQAIKIINYFLKNEKLYIHGKKGLKGYFFVSRISDIQASDVKLEIKMIMEQLKQEQ
jgi:hypothetical protein